MTGVIAGIAVTLFAAVCITRVILFVASPDSARGLFLVPILLVGALTVVKAASVVIDRDAHILNLSDLLYTVACVASVATTLLFMATLHPPNRPSRRALIFTTSTVVALTTAVIIQWATGPYHGAETPDDGSVWQPVAHLNWLITLPTQLYVAVGVAYAGVSVLRYGLVPGNERFWRIGLILMAVGIEMAAAGDALTLVRLFTAPPSFAGLNSASELLQYGASAVFSVGLLLPVATIAATRLEIRRLTPLWAKLTTAFPGHTLDTGPNRSHADLRKTAGRRFVEIVECLGLLTLNGRAEAAVEQAADSARTLGSMLAGRPVTALHRPGGLPAAERVFAGALTITDQRAVTLRIAMAHNRAHRSLGRSRPGISADVH